MVWLFGGYPWARMPIRLLLLHWSNFSCTRQDVGFWWIAFPALWLSLSPAHFLLKSFLTFRPCYRPSWVPFARKMNHPRKENIKMRIIDSHSKGGKGRIIWLRNPFHVFLEKWKKYVIFSYVSFRRDFPHHFQSPIRQTLLMARYFRKHIKITGLSI